MNNRPLIQLLPIFAALSSGAQTFDVATDFSASENPNGPWSYGYSLTLGGELILYTSTMSLLQLNYWLYDISSSDPQVHHNPTTATVTYITQQVPAGGFGLHPGPNGEFSVVKFTTPTTGMYHVTGSFFGEDTRGTSTDVHILTNGVSLLDDEVTGLGPGSGPSFDMELALSAGDQLEFVVGYGTNAHFSNDSTGLSLQVLSVVLLQLVHSGDSVILTWPAFASGFFLESTPSLTAPNWSPVSDPPVAIGDRNAVTLEATNATRFFRLNR